MIDPTSYALALYQVMTAKNRAVITTNLHHLSNLTEIDKRALSSLNQNRLKQFLARFSPDTDELNTLLTILWSNRAIHHLPKVYRALRRELRRQHIPVIEVTSATSDMTTDIFKKHFGADAIIIPTSDPRLIAGLLVRTDNGMYEYSIDQQLHQLKNVLAAEKGLAHG